MDKLSQYNDIGLTYPLEEGSFTGVDAAPKTEILREMLK